MHETGVVVMQENALKFMVFFFLFFFYPIVINICGLNIHVNAESDSTSQRPTFLWQ